MINEHNPPKLMPVSFLYLFLSFFFKKTKTIQRWPGIVWLKRPMKWKKRSLVPLSTINQTPNVVTTEYVRAPYTRICNTMPKT